MKLQVSLALVGILFGALVFLLYPQLLDFSLQYTLSLQKELDSSMVRGTPVALATSIIPLFFGLFGFFIGYLLKKLIEKVHNIPRQAIKDIHKRLTSV